jgi:hypothetical protein
MQLHYRNGWHRVGIALDQVLNALLGGNPDETLSARAWREEQLGSARWGRCRRAIDRLFFWQSQHCRAAFRAEARTRRRWLHEYGELFYRADV